MWKLIASRDYDSGLGYNMTSSTTYIANTLEEIDTIIRIIEDYGVGDFSYNISPPRSKGDKENE